jgi:hypothetical protein
MKTAVIALAFMLAACGGGNEPPKTVAVFGDSTTFGALPVMPYACGARLQTPWVTTAAKVSGLRLTNEGRNGTTLDQLMAGTNADGVCGNPPAHLPFAQWLAANPDAVVVIAYGINEAIRGQALDYRPAIATAHAAGRSVILLEPTQVESRPYLPADLVPRVNAIRDSLRAYGVPVITVRELDAPGNVPDGLHPHQQYADALGAHIGLQLKRQINK